MKSRAAFFVIALLLACFAGASRPNDFEALRARCSSLEVRCLKLEMAVDDYRKRSERQVEAVSRLHEAVMARIDQSDSLERLLKEVVQEAIKADLKHTEIRRK